MEEPKKPDKIEINFDELPEKEPADRLVINVDEKPLEKPMLKGISKSSKADALQKKTNLPFWQLALAGLAGGLIAWGTTEISYSGYTIFFLNINGYLYKTDIFMVVVAGLIGATIGSVRGISHCRSVIAIIGIIIGLFFGLIGGTVGGLLYHKLIEMLLTGQPGNFYLYFLCNGFAWGLVGLFIGLGQGLGSFRIKAVTNGLVGGLIGAIIGGVLFSLFLFNLSYSDSLVRLIALTSLGFSTGSSIGLMQIKNN